jgi:heterodisulfide reductase subunit C
MSGVQETVLYEKGMDLDFMEEVYRIPGGGRLKECIQCGTCSGSCPVSWAMEESPRQIIAMIRAGMKDRVLESATPWTCASCYQCTVRCPQEIKITDVMYILKRMSIRANARRSRGIALFSKTFIKVVRQTGRNNEARLLVDYAMGTNPFASIKDAGLGLGLKTRGRLPLSAKPVKDLAGLRRMIDKAQQLGGEE